jgi:hypothetical protein
MAFSAHKAIRILYLLIPVALAGFVLFESASQGDFLIYLDASRDLIAGKDVYSSMYNADYHYYYDLIFALVLYPLTFLPLYLSQLIWLSLNAVLIVRIWRILSSWLPLTAWNADRIRLLAISCFLFSLQFIRDNMHLGQMSIFMLYICLESVRLINNGSYLKGNALLAFGITVKLLPLIVLLYLFCRGKFKAVAVTVLFACFFLILPGLIIGFEWNNFLLKSRWDLLNPSRSIHILDTTERSFHSLTSFLAVFLVKNTGDPNAMSLPRNITDLSLAALSTVILIARLAFVSGGIYFLLQRDHGLRTSRSELYGLSYFLLLGPLLFPHQQHYAFFFATPGIAWLLYFYLSGIHAGRKTFLFCLVLVFFLFNSRILLGQFNNYYDHFKTLTWGILLLIGLLAWAKPSKLPLTIEIEPVPAPGS